MCVCVYVGTKEGGKVAEIIHMLIRGHGAC